MSFSAWVTIGFVDRHESIVGMIRTLCDAGWSVTPPDYEGPISFYLEHAPGECDWGCLPTEQALATLGEYDQKGQACGLQLYWAANDPLAELCIELHLRPAQNQLAISIFGPRMILDDVAPFTDLSWYSKNIVGPLKRSGLAVRELQWHESD
jgi:hypothetical protein